MTTYLTDTFTRVTANGWGTPDTGPAYTLLGGVAANYATDGSVGTNSCAANVAQNVVSNCAAANDQEATGRLRFGTMPVGGNATALVELRRAATPSDTYRATIVVTPAGVVQGNMIKRVANVQTTLVANTTATGLTATAGAWFRFRFQVVGTTLKLRIWADGSAEPATWLITTTDSAIASGAYAAFCAFMNSTITNGPIVVSYDDLSVTDVSVAATGHPGRRRVPPVELGPDDDEEVVAIIAARTRRFS